MAKFDLSELLLGQKLLERALPIQCCKIPDVIDGKGPGNNSEKIVGKPGSVDGPGGWCVFSLLTCGRHLRKVVLMRIVNNNFLAVSFRGRTNAYRKLFGMWKSAEAED